MNANAIITRDARLHLCDYSSYIAARTDEEYEAVSNAALTASDGFATSIQGLSSLTLNFMSRRRTAFQGHPSSDRR